MDLSRVLRTPIIVEHVTQTGPPDDMGDPTEERTWTRFLGYVWQESVTEQTGNGPITVEQSRVALERSARGQIDSGDRIYEDGELDEDGDYVDGTGEAYDVEGRPWEARNPRTQLFEYVQARIVRSE